MTATERRYKGSSDKVLSMDDPETYGDTFHQLSFKQAMECQPPILCDYNIITIGVSRDEVRDLIKRNAFVRPTGGKWNEEMEADMLAAMIALRKAMKDYPIKHAVSFHSSIQRAELFKEHNDTFSQEFPEFGALDTFHVSGKTPTGTRSNIIKSFAEADRSLVTNARCLTEGVDVPGIDCVLFADPKRSTVDIVQAVGRALRPSEGKKLGYVILPILHNNGSTSDQIIESGEFNDVLSTISALAANDNRIIEYFRGVSEGRNSTGSSRVSFEWNERMSELIDVSRLVQDLEIKCWGRLAKLSWRPFEEARAWARSLGLKTWSEWHEYCAESRKDLGTRPPDIPSNPDKNYRDQGWISGPDWIGSDYLSAKLRRYLPFEDARRWAQQCGAKSYNQWIALVKTLDFPANIPKRPEKTYAGIGWVSYGDWLGTGTMSPKDYKSRWLPFEEAKAWVHQLKLKGVYEWRDFTKGKMPNLPRKPDNIPASPDRAYLNSGWNGYGDWVGTGFVHFGLRNYLPYEEAKAFAHKLQLPSAKQWRLYSKGLRPDKGTLPSNIPATPNTAYENKGWVSWGDWLGTDTIAVYNRTYLPFAEAREFVRALKLRRQQDWIEYCQGKLAGHGKKPENIPSTPGKLYADQGWRGYGDWLGTGRVAAHLKVYRNFVDARLFARSLGLKTKTEWTMYSQGLIPRLGTKPDDIPLAADRTYLDKGWISWSDWLGPTFKGRGR